MEGIKSLQSTVDQPSTSRPTTFNGVLQVIYESLSDLNVQLPEPQRLEKSLSTVLFGAGGKLDSLCLANFIVIAEQKLEDRFAFRLDLTEDDPFSPTTGHFRTVDSLATHVSDLVARRLGETR